jgi:transglutaminase-like putative cysteine protease
MPGKKLSASLVLLTAALFFSCGGKAPVITALNPRIGVMGGMLTIEGEHFGREQGGSYVTIAGTAPTASSYTDWQDTRITLRIPEFGDSGLVYVYSRGGKSNGALFSNQATIPRPVQGRDFGTGPRILSVEPPSGSVGALVTITGSGFGNSRETGGVLFSWDAEPSPAAPAEIQTPGSVEVFAADFGYELWNEHEIQVRVPDGAISGNMFVRTPRGDSRPVYFEISDKPGTKTFRDKRSYTISHSVDIKVNDAGNPNTLYLWVPRPVRSASQGSIELLSRSGEPLMDDSRGTTLFQFSDIGAGTSITVSQSYKVEVYAQETTVRPQSVRQEDSPIKSQFTAASALVPSADPRIKAQAAAIIGRERNPYIKAQRIYEWIIGEVKIQRTPLEGGAVEALQNARADPYQAALLYCALARAAEIPCLPAAGILIDRGLSAEKHFWAEFWIDGFGWIPVDPVLGAGAAPVSFNLREDRASWYFGSLDSQRIIFARGETPLSHQMDPRGRSTLRSRDYAFQQIREEAVGGLESYSSLWGDVTITGMYAQ